MTRWRTRIIVILVAVVVLAVAVIAARWLRTSPGIQSFLIEYPGAVAPLEGAPVGFPVWLQWQHFLNGFFLLLIIRSGWLVRTTKRPEAYWTRKNNGLIRTKRAPARISLNLWLHLSVDALWLLNGVIFVVLIFVTGQWMRIVPTSLEFFPNAVSAALQYLSLDWPVEDGWVNYNSLQVIAYFVTVFIAAPVALITGLRMSPLWPKATERLNKAYPIELARAVHFPTMLYFVLFIVVHVALVLATGALRNLNHMYGGGDEVNWLGFGIFAASIVVMIGAWFLARPIFLRPIASLTGKVSR